MQNLKFFYLSEDEDQFLLLARVYNLYICVFDYANQVWVRVESIERDYHSAEDFSSIGYRMLPMPESAAVALQQVPNGKGTPKGIGKSFSHEELIEYASEY